MKCKCSVSSTAQFSIATMSSATTALVVLLCAAQALARFPAPRPDFIENVKEMESSRIVSGWPAQLGEQPHQVSLRMVNDVGTVTGCGGNIVHTDWVITAAHCTAARVTLVVRAGLVDLTRPEYIYEALEWYNYPSYQDSMPSVVQPDDISIVKLLRPVVYSDNLRPIRIQSSADAFKNYGDRMLVASGYGTTWTSGSSSSVLNFVYLVGLSNENCRASFGSIITDNSICARYYNVTSQSVCQGDSGGPLVVSEPDGHRYLVGVASFVAGLPFGCHSGFPAGFIRPGPFHEWFTEVTGIDFNDYDSLPQPPPPSSPSPPTEPPTTATEPATTDADSTAADAMLLL